MINSSLYKKVSKRKFGIRINIDFFSLLTSFLIMSLLTTGSFAQGFSQTYVYKGTINVDRNKKIKINLNFLMLLDSTMVGSYFYQPKSGSLKLVGHLNKDKTFYLVERDENDSITGYFKGNLSVDFKIATGKWSNPSNTKVYDFEISQVFGQSYWDFIKKNRALYEYKDIKQAIAERDKVLSIDFSHQQLTKLPDALKGLTKIVSISLLGNNFTSFPMVITKLKTLDEISLSSNELTYVTPEIGKLSNLRILIMNFNKIEELPKEIVNLRELLYLEIGNNQLTTLPEEIKNLTKLQELHIGGNKLSEDEKVRIRKLLPNCVVHF